MEIDQIIFKKLVKYFTKSDPELENPNRVQLSELHGRLSLLAKAVCGASIEIVGSEREGGWSDDTFFLPKAMSLFDSVEKNTQLFLFRVFYLSIQYQEELNWAPDERRNIPESQEESRKISVHILPLLFDEYPGLEEVYETLQKGCPSIDGMARDKDYTWLYGRYMKNSADYSRRKALEEIGDAHQETQSDEMEKPTTEIEAKAADELEILQVDKKAQQDFMLTHNFEKVDTVDEFNGVWRDFDGEDELSEQAEAMQEYNLKQLVRVDDPVHSVYKSDFRGDTHIAESANLEEQAVTRHYPEWDYKKRNYKVDFCKLFHKRLLSVKRNYYENTITQNQSTLIELRKRMAMFHNERELVRRQPYGESLDLDAVIDLYADIKAKRTPDERFYLHKKRAQKDLSLIILLDLSLSTDGYVHGNRIIDVEKQVSILFGEVLNEFNIDFQIDGFFSKTRNYITYITLKEFDQPWDEAKLRIGAIEPQGYTRIGPAFRHANHLFSKRKSQKKWIVVLSDGKPNDYDRYEGKYGIEDIKQSLREVRSDGVHSFALAVEEQAKYYLPQIFGKNHYNVLSSPAEMINALTSLYERIQSGS